MSKEKKEEVKEEKVEVKGEVVEPTPVAVAEKGHKGLTALFFILFSVIVLGVLSIILIPKLIYKGLKVKENLTFEINSEVKYSDMFDVRKNTRLDDPDALVDTSKLGEQSLDVVYYEGKSQEIINVKIKIVDTTKPEIKCEDKIEVYVGNEFNPNSYCEFTDNSKEELIPNVSGDYDTDKEGEYKITISVKDSSGNEATKDTILNVKKPELHYDGYYVYKTNERWDEFSFKEDGKGGYYPWFCPGSGCGAYGEEGTYTIEGSTIILHTTTQNSEGEVSTIDEKYEFVYVNKEEIKLRYKGQELSCKWQKEYDK